MNYTIAIKSIDNKIKYYSELKDLIKFAEHSKYIDEDTYHKLCHTELKYSEDFGKQIGDQLGLTLSKSYANEFRYCLEDGYTLVIPKADTPCVYIEVDSYYIPFTTNDPYYNQLENKLEKQLKYKNSLVSCQNKSAFYKASKTVGTLLNNRDVTYGYELHPYKATLRYMLGKKKYNAKLKNMIKEATETEVKIRLEINEYIKSYMENYAIQRYKFSEYVTKLFSWTAKVYIKFDNRCIETFNKGV